MYTGSSIPLHGILNDQYFISKKQETVNLFPDELRCSNSAAIEDFYKVKPATPAANIQHGSC